MFTLSWFAPPPPPKDRKQFTRILTVEDADQAWARARVSEGDKGGGAARAALEMIALRRRFLGQDR
jgi:hypothetical protein